MAKNSLKNFDKFVKKGAIKRKQVPIKAGSWLGNVAKSLGYSTMDVIDNIMPSTVDVVTTAAENADQIRNMATGLRQTKSRISTSLNQSVYTDLLRQYGKNWIEDLKSGDLYNKARYDANVESAVNAGMDDISLDDDDFDFGGFDEDFDDLDDDDFDMSMDSDDGDASVNFARKHNGRNEATKITMINNLGQDSPLVQSTQFQTQVIAQGVGTIVEADNANTKIKLMGMTQLANNQISALAALNNTSATGFTQLSESVTKIEGLAGNYFNDSIGNQKTIIAKLDTIIDKMGSLGQGSDDRKKKELKGYDRLLTGSLLDMDNYKDYVKNNLNNYIDSNMALSTFKMFFEDKDTLSSIIAAPGRYLIEGIINQFLPSIVQESMKTLDSTVNEFALSALSKLGTYTDDKGNPILQALGDIFGIRSKRSTTVSKENYIKGAVPFDGITHKTINEVIPAYLRQIAAAVTGTEERAFDYTKGVFRKTGDIRKDYDDELRKVSLSEYSDDINQFMDMVRKQYTSSTKDQIDEIRKKFEDVTYKMINSGGIPNYRPGKKEDEYGDVVNYLADLTGEGSDSDIAKLMYSFFEGRHLAGNNAANLKYFFRKMHEARQAQTKLTYDREYDGIANNVQYASDNGLEIDPNRKKGSGDSKGTYISDEGGPNADKYGKKPVVYLRNILSTLNRGIKVFVTNPSGSSRNGKHHPLSSDASDIITGSSRSLDDLKQDDATWFNKYNTSAVVRSDRTLLSADKRGKLNLDGEDGLDVRQMVSAAHEYFSNENVAALGDLDAKKSIFQRLSSDKTGFGRFMGKTSNVIDNIASYVQTGIHGADDALYAAIFGGDLGSAGPLVKATVATVKEEFSKVSGFIKNRVLLPLDDAVFGDHGLIRKIESSDTFNRVMTQIKSFGSKASKFIFGDKSNTGFSGGLISNTMNELGEIGNKIKDFIIGKKGPDGKSLPLDKDDSVFGNIKKAGRWVSNSIGSMLGFDPNITERPVSFKDSIKSHLSDVWSGIKDRASEWADLLFGKSSEDESKDKSGGGSKVRDILNSFRGEMKGKSGKLGAAAVIGAGTAMITGGNLGLFTSLFLPGGPIGGAILGTSIGIISQSDNLKNLLFGDKDENGDRLGGLITRDFMDFFKDNKLGIGIGGLAGLASQFGLIPSFFLPGGPIGGAIAGGAISLAVKSGLINDILYGKGGTKDDPTGGLKNAFKKIFGKDARLKDIGVDLAIGSGAGIVGSFFLPGGPILGALLGTAASIALNTDKVKNFLFGETDENGDRKGGILNRFSSYLHDNILLPFAQSVEEAQANFLYFVKSKMVLPLQVAMKPLTNKFKEIGKSIQTKITDVFTSIKTTFNEKVTKRLGESLGKLVDGTKKIFGGLGKFIFGLAGRLVSAPFRAVGGLGKAVYHHDMRRGANAATKEKLNEGADTLINDIGESVVNGEGFKGKVAGIGAAFKKSYGTFKDAFSDETRKAGAYGEKGAYYASEEENADTAYAEGIAKLEAERQASLDKIAQRYADKKNGKSKPEEPPTSDSQTDEPTKISSTINDTMDKSYEQENEHHSETMNVLNNIYDVINQNVGNTPSPKSAPTAEGGTTVSSPISDIIGEPEVDENGKPRPGKFKMNLHRFGYNNTPNQTSTTATNGTTVNSPEESSETDDSHYTSLEKDVSDIADSVHGQLNGVGSNINKIYRLLLKTTGMEDDDIHGENNKEYVGFWGRIRTAINRPIKFIQNAITAPFRAVQKAVGGIVGKITGFGKSIAAHARNFVIGMTSMLPSLIKLPKILLSRGIGMIKKYSPVIGKTLLNTAKFIATNIKSGISFAIKAIKEFGPTLKKGLQSAAIKIKRGLITATTVIVRSVHFLANKIRGAASGFSKLMSGVWTRAKGLLGKAGLIGKKAFTKGKALAKRGLNFVGGVAARGLNAAKSVASGVLGKITGFKFKMPSIAPKGVYILGGTIDKVSTVDDIGRNVIGKLGKLISKLNPGQPIASPIEEIVEDVGSDQTTVRRPGHHVKFGMNLQKFGYSAKSGVTNTARQAKEDAELQTRVSANSAESINQKFEEADKEKEDRSFKTRLLGLLGKNTETAQKSHFNFLSIFGKKGLITMAIMAAIPLIIKFLPNILNGLKTLVSIGNDLFGGIKREGGIGGVINNAGEQINDATKQYTYKIDKDGNLVTDENGNYVKESMSEGKGILTRVGNWISPYRTKIDTKTGKARRVREMNSSSEAKSAFIAGQMIHAERGSMKMIRAAASTGSGVVTTAKKALELGSGLLSKTEKGSEFYIKNHDRLTKLGETLNSASKTKTGIVSTVIKKFIDIAKSAINKLASVADGLITQLAPNLASEGAGPIQTLFSKVEGLLNGNILTKFLTKIQGVLAKFGISVSTATLADIGLGAFGFINTNPAEIFQVNKKDVDMKMQVIARGLKAFLTTSYGSTIGLLVDIGSQVLGFNLLTELAILIYNTISDPKDIEKLKESRASMQQDWETLVQQEYEAYAQNETANGRQPMSFEEFKKSDLCTDFDEFNSSKNKTLVRSGIDAVKGVGNFIFGGVKGIGNGIRSIGNGIGSAIKGVGSTIGKGVTGINNFVNKFIGYDPNKSIGENIVGVAKTAVIGVAFGGVGVIARVIKNVTTKKGYYDVYGGYYVENSDGGYDYYNANNELVRTVSDPEDISAVQAQISSGILTVKTAPNNPKSKIDRAVANISNKASDFWKNAKSALSKAWDNAKSAVANGAKSIWGFLTGGNNSDSTDTDGGSGGFGDGPSTINGMPYYSQNDPKYKDKPYNLSNGMSDTMGNRGCGPTAMAMVASKVTGRPVDPQAMAQMAQVGGYSTEVGTTPGFFSNAASALGMNVTEQTPNGTALDSNKPMIIQGRDSDPNSPFTSRGHYVVGRANGNRIAINDPRGARYSKDYDVSEVMKGAQRIWTFDNNGGYGRGKKRYQTGGYGEQLLTPEAVYKVANAEIGYLEKKSNSDLDDKTANAGSNNYTKYGRDMKIAGHGNGDFWCATFICWCFWKAAGEDLDRAKRALGSMSASCETIRSALPHDKNPRVGDVVFFKGSRHSGANHIALVVNVTKDMIFTIEGNTSGGSTVVDNGGAVAAKSYGINDEHILDYGHPNYEGQTSFAGTVPDGVSPNASISNGSSSSTSSSGTGEKFTSLTSMLASAASRIGGAMMKAYGFNFDTDDGSTTDPSSGTTIASGASTTNGVISGNGQQEQVWNYFKSMGWSDEATAGIMGNFQQESGNNPNKIQGNGKGPAAGIAQWENYNSKSDRWAQMAAYAKSKGKDWTDLQSQLDFVMKELRGDKDVDTYTSTLLKRKAGSLEAYSQLKDYKSAVDMFEESFERAGKPMMENRYKYAKEIYDQFKGKTPTTVAKADDTNIDTTTSGGSGGFGDGVRRPTRRVNRSYDSVNPAAKPQHRNTGGGFGDTEAIALLQRVVSLLESSNSELSDINGGIDDLNDKDYSVKQYVDNSTNTKNYNNVTNKTSRNDGGHTFSNEDYTLAKELAKGLVLT